MIEINNIDVWGWEHAIRGMRNPMNSWEKSDSGRCGDINCSDCIMLNNDSLCNSLKEGMFVLGRNDLSLMQRLYKAGTEHRKYMRQIMISMDITAPLYWWKEFDTYKVGTVANSTSTMHKIHTKEFTFSDFSIEHLDGGSLTILEYTINQLNSCRNKYNKYNDIQDKKRHYWWQMIQLLPSSYNQKRTITMNYENAVSMIKQRAGHKLDEWNEFVEVLNNLPYMEEITR